MRDILADSKIQSVTSGSISKSDISLKHYGLIVLVGLILALPLILYGLPFAAHDAPTHAEAYTNFSNQLWSGELYPRWLLGMNGGLGSPSLFYYPPVAYYLTSILKPLLVNDLNGFHQLGVSASLALVASGLSSYLWLSKISNEKSALCAALVYMLMPYHLAHDLHIRGAIAEFWAFVWMPLVLYFVIRVVRRQRFGLAGLAIAFALLFMTHLLTTLMFILVPICYAWYLAEPGRKLRVTGVILGAITLGVGLSAIYLLPAMTTQDFVQLANIKSGYYYYENWFLRSNLRIDGELRLSWIIFQVGGLAVLAFLVGWPKSTVTRKKELTFWMVASVLSIFMMLPFSDFIWKLIPTLQILQFPWRFNAILCLATLPLLALALSSIRAPYSRFAAAALVCLVFISLFWIYDLGRRSLQSYHSQVAHSQEMNRGNVVNIDEMGFRPKWLAIKDTSELVSLLDQIGHGVDGLSKAKIVEGTGTVAVNKWEPRNIAFQVDTPTGISLDVSQAYYPGWTAHITGGPQNLHVEPSVKNGLVKLSVPPGRHELSLRLEKSRVEYFGELVSVCCLILTIVLVAVPLAPRMRLLGGS